MPTQIYVASLAAGCPIASLDGLKMAREVNKAAANEGRTKSVDELERFLRDRVHRDDILLYGLGVYCRDDDEIEPERNACTDQSHRDDDGE